jgi:hypothetical protein
MEQWKGDNVSLLSKRFFFMVILLPQEAGVARQRPVNMRPRKQTRWLAIARQRPLTRDATVEKLFEAVVRSESI